MEKKNKPPVVDDSLKNNDLKLTKKLNDDKKQNEEKLIDGKCTTCMGVTCYLHAMSLNKRKPYCIGYEQKRDVPPYMINIEEVAKKQANSIESSSNNHDFVGIGMTVWTPKMEAEGKTPLLIKGQGMRVTSSMSTNNTETEKWQISEDLTKNGNTTEEWKRREDISEHLKISDTNDLADKAKVFGGRGTLFCLRI